MSIERIWLYQKLITAPSLIDFCDDRMFQGESMDGAPKKKPFLIYRMGNTSPDNDVRAARRQYCTIYLHDDAQPGDYTRIDQGMNAVVDLLEDCPPDPAYHLITARWLENSSDQDDREMGTILRYARFQLILSEWT